MDDKKRRIKFLQYPGRIIFIYLMTTVFLYFWGPYKWKIGNPILVCSYLLLNYFAVILGYNSSIKKIKTTGAVEDKKNNTMVCGIAIFRFVMIYCIVSHFVFSYYVYGGISFEKVLNMAQSYLDNREYEASHNIFTRLITYFWGINYFYLPIGIMSFRKISVADKVLFFGAMVSDILFWLSIGTMKGLGDIIFMSAIPIYLSAINNRKSKASIKKTSNRRKRLIIIGGIIFIITVLYSQYMRMSLRGKAVNYVSPLVAQHLWYIDYDWFLSGINSLIFYVSHGYQGLSYALQLPFQWTYFIGNSRALTKIFENHLLGAGVISNNIYPARVEAEFGWNNGSIWPSCFSWLASDISFVFIPVLLFFLARLLAKTINEAVTYNRISALVLASYLCIFFVYLPCNNQIVQSERSFYSLILIVIMYVLEKKKIRFVIWRR